MVDKKESDLAVSVFFEDKKGISSELVATFKDDALYNLCLPALDAWAAQNGGIITESVPEGAWDLYFSAIEAIEAIYKEQLVNEEEALDWLKQEHDVRFAKSSIGDVMAVKLKEGVKNDQ